MQTRNIVGMVICIWALFVGSAAHAAGLDCSVGFIRFGNNFGATTVQDVHQPDYFEGEPIRMRFSVHNPSDDTLYALDRDDLPAWASGLRLTIQGPDGVAVRSTCFLVQASAKRRQLPNKSALVRRSSVSTYWRLETVEGGNLPEGEYTVRVVGVAAPLRGLTRSGHFSIKKVKTRNDRLNALYNLGMWDIDQKRYASAERRMREILRLCPNSPSGHVGLAYTYERSNQYAAAIQEYEKVILILEQKLFPPEDSFIGRVDTFGDYSSTLKGVVILLQRKLAANGGK